MRPAELLRFAGIRLLAALPLLLLVVVVNFSLIQLAPGDPATILVGDYPAPPDYIEEVRREFGLDQPLHVQLGRYVGQVVQGNLGYSFANRQPVLDLVLARLGSTLKLTGTAILLASVVGVVLGVLA